MAAQLEPVATLVVDAVEPVSGLKTLDLACGTGNAALLEAERGAKVTGFDAAPRLLEVAAEQAAEAGLDATWVEGDMHDMPFPDDSFEVITSVFGVIFGDPQKVTAEIARVLEPNGRIAITTWTNEGVLPRISALSKEAVADVFDQETEPMQFQWGDETQLRELFSEHGIALQCETKNLKFTAESAEAANEEWREHHPMWLALKEALGDERFDALSEKILEELKSSNESEDGFSYTSTYLLAVGSPV
ncbi:MAG: class I SAM-dependent methyltransferase [Thermoleophilia bacterium]|nr:class I SAM-dependent methyltransferase [Thermoleophilia bacterium]